MIPSVASMPPAAMAAPYAPASASQGRMSAARIAVGGTVLTMPTPRPWIATVAGPVTARSLVEITGPKSKEVKYSVTFLGPTMRYNNEASQAEAAEMMTRHY